ncbi:hypothetical protein JTB14_013612 [Gonioctena quinquepunctata]|nr:hypothetical protein JTB14_013612 [Gonioctena quinquepunctata]
MKWNSEFNKKQQEEKSKEPSEEMETRIKNISDEYNVVKVEETHPHLESHEIIPNSSENTTTFSEKVIKTDEDAKKPSSSKKIWGKFRKFAEDDLKTYTKNRHPKPRRVTKNDKNKKYTGENKEVRFPSIVIKERVEFPRNNSQNILKQPFEIKGNPTRALVFTKSNEHHKVLEKLYGTTNTDHYAFTQDDVKPYGSW